MWKSEYKIVVLSFSFYDFEFWIVLDLHEKCKDSTDNSCMRFTKLPPMLTFYITMENFSKLRNKWCSNREVQTLLNFRCFKVFLLMCFLLMNFISIINLGYQVAFSHHRSWVFSNLWQVYNFSFLFFFFFCWP